MENGKKVTNEYAKDCMINTNLMAKALLLLLYC